MLVVVARRMGDWENDRVGGWAKSEERTAAGNLYIELRRYIPVPAMVDAV